MQGQSGTQKLGDRTPDWNSASFLHYALETRWLGVRKTCRIGFFYRNYRSRLEETGWLGAGFISVCLKTRWAGSKNVVSMCRIATVLDRAF
jgi:hypothetical protein